eukprot:COSAG02_NODE_3_length_74588_cov_108.368430_4_plen_300_part_00
MPNDCILRVCSRVYRCDFFTDVTLSQCKIAFCIARPTSTAQSRCPPPRLLLQNTADRYSLAPSPHVHHCKIVIIRGAYPCADIPRLVQRLIDRRFMRGPNDPVELTCDGTLSDVLRDEHGRVYKGSKYLRPGANGRGSRPGMGGWTPSRIDIGTSFGGGGWPDKEAFLAHSAGTTELFSTLFDGLADPVEALYSCCSALANTEQRVMVAHEPDGRSYGPAIFRVHYPGHDYQPHINHVGQTVRARRLHNLAPKAPDVPHYEVFRFDHQLAALICVQHTTLGVSRGHSKTVSGECQPFTR